LDKKARPTGAASAVADDHHHRLGGLCGGSMIERLLLLHTALTEISTGRSSLDDDASNDELVEPILFYYNASSSSTNKPSSSTALPLSWHHQNGVHSLGDESSRQSANDAIRFAGLCTALYTLPQSFHDSPDQSLECNDDTTRVVHLQRSSLVFVPLESEDRSCPVGCDNTDSDARGTFDDNASSKSSTLVLGVVQIQRSCPSDSGNQRSTKEGPPPPPQTLTTPYSIRCALQRAHANFCLWRGGGIHERLMQSLHDQGAAAERTLDDHLPHRCEIVDSRETTKETAARRRLYPGMDDWYRWRRALRRLSETATRQECDEILARLTELQERLPMTQLRHDLSIHYHEFCTNGLLGRAVVEGIPPIMPTLSGDHLWRSAPPSVGTVAKDMVLTAIDQILDFSARSVEGRGLLLGVTAFARGQQIVPTRTYGDFSIVGEATTSQLLGHSLALVEWQMCSHGQHRRDHALSTMESPKKNSPLRPFALSFVADDMNDPLRDEKGPRREGDGGFLSPPPLSFLSALDSANAFADHRGGQVWAPPISLPLQFLEKDRSSSSKKRRVNVRICWFSRGDFSFLLMLRRLAVEDPSTVYLEIFQGIEEKLVAVLDDVEELSSNQSSPMSGYSNVQHAISNWENCGQDIVAIDRNLQTVILLTSSDRGADERRDSDRFNNNGMTKNDGMPEWIDCRYRLANQLSSESLYAFDDAMDEVARYTERYESGSIEPYEMCTLLSNNRWFYAFAHGPKELYVLFDTALFVTVADVQQAAARIRGELLFPNVGEQDRVRSVPGVHT
jgi:hypothetical protein